MIYAIENQNFKIKDSHGVKYEIPIERPDFFQVTSFVTILKHINIIQGLAMKAINNPRSAESDPILIREFPDPNNPTSLLSQFSTWISEFGSAADLGQRISTHIQSRFLNIKVSLPLLSILRSLIRLS